MKETVKSLQTYFVVAALLSGYAQVRDLMDEQPFMLVKVMSGIALAFAVGFLVVGITLKSLLVKAPGAILFLIVAAALVNLADTGAAIWVVYEVVGSRVMELLGWMVIVRLAVVMLICGYLFINVKRLAKEAKALP